MAGEFYTVNDLVELLYVGRKTIYDLLRSGELKGFRIGRNWRVPSENLEAFIIQKGKQACQ